VTVGAQGYFKHLHMCHGKWTKLVVFMYLRTSLLNFGHLEKSRMTFTDMHTATV